MTLKLPHHPTGWLLLAVLGLGALPCWAQYKVVMPDGSVTYTDRPRADGNARITPMGRSGIGAATPSAADASLPLELRQAMQRYPVTLYTSADCGACESGRRHLQQRGVPYTERRVASEEDAIALERAAGGRTVPALTIGAQPLRGFSETDWTAYLDAASYPRESKLPRDWQNPMLVAQGEKPAPVRATPPALPTPTPATEPGNPDAAPPQRPGGVRF